MKTGLIAATLIAFFVVVGCFLFGNEESTHKKIGANYEFDLPLQVLNPGTTYIFGTNSGNSPAPSIAKNNTHWMVDTASVVAPKKATHKRHLLVHRKHKHRACHS